jgi:hypothetical protein
VQRLPSRGLVTLYVFASQRQQLLHLEDVACAGIGAHLQGDLQEAGHLFVQGLGNLGVEGWRGVEGGELVVVRLAACGMLVCVEVLRY